MSAHAPLRPFVYRGLMPIVIDGQALLGFSERIDLQLSELEERFPAAERPVPLAQRKTWQPLPKKPR